MALFTPTDVIGIVGLISLLTGFVGNLMGRIPANSRRYILFNLMGSLFLAVYSYLIASWVFFPLQIVWASAAIWALVKHGSAEKGLN